jgi:penicillin amidase
MKAGKLLGGIGLLAAGALSAGCALLAPLPPETSLDQRLASIPATQLPLKGRVSIHWDDHQIPFIEADDDGDAAFALGLVHAHLRLGQMEVYRRVSQGRIAEMGGPLATDYDYGLRLLGYGRAAAAIEAMLPPTTRAWLERFVAGINHYQRHAPEMPHEYAILGLDREPWTVRDVLTFGRLAGTDVNWLIWNNLIRLRGRPDWPQLWARLVRNGSASLPSFAGSGDRAALEAILAGLSRSGSNSLAVAPSRSKTGAALMANDPHLGISIPNTWLVAGLKTPTIHVVGLMAPGLPFFAIGRNPWIAWGGTNMRAASSELYDASGLAPGEIAERRETIRVRWWFDREVTIRDAPWGPVISDAPQFDGVNGKAFALRWTGHQASDEVSAMLAVARARNFAEFRRAFATFAVPGQNMLYADAAGHIGQVLAVKLPDRNGAPPSDLIVDPADGEKSWRRSRDAEDLPFALDPADGFVVSGNNRPAETDVQIGYFFSPDDRVRRMREIIQGNGKLGVEELERLQQDVYMPSSVALRDLLLRKLDDSGLAAPVDARSRDVVDLMRGWDGHYRAESRGALAFELFQAAFTARFYEAALGNGDGEAFANVGRIKALMVEDVAAADPVRLRPALASALAAAAERLPGFADWGDAHRLRLAHPLGFLPVLGSRYRYGDVAVGGSTDTLMKTAHAPVEDRHPTRYGSNARHISDLADLDRNWFVLLGGQDGWINSANFLDQSKLWLKGRYIQVPLRIESVRARFPHKTVLAP